MKNQSNQDYKTGLGIRIDIQYAKNSGVLGRPNLISSELSSNLGSSNSVNPPLPYFTDAIIGLSTLKLFLHAKGTLTSQEEAFTALLWQRLEPLHEVYQRSHQRIQPLLSTHTTDVKPLQKLEQSLKEIIDSACRADGIHVPDLFNLIDSLNYLEIQRSRPLLFDTNIHFSTATLNTLHTLYSLLFNVRAIVALHYNSFCKDSLYETLPIDSVKDYFHAPDLLTNESLLYYHFINLKKNGYLDSRGEASLSQAFRNYLPYSHYLVHSLPEEFFSQQPPELLEQSLYTFQIDWLLGSPAGLIYRIREELIGLKEGYENTFWPEIHLGTNIEPTTSFQAQCLLDAEHIRQLSEAA